MTNPSYPLVSFGLDDARIKNIATFNKAEPTPPNTNFSDLQTGITTVVPYATFEPNFWALNGTYHFMPASPHVGYFGPSISNGSGTISGYDGNFQIQLSSPQNLTSFTLHFDNTSSNWCSQINVAFLDPSLSVIYQTTFYPTGVDFTITYNIPNCNTIYVNLQITNNPYRFARLTGVYFNAVTHLDGTKISDAKITEEFSPISATLTANKLELDLLLDNSDFSVVNPNSLYANLPQGMPFTVYEVVDNVSVLMGMFYYLHWDNPSP